MDEKKKKKNAYASLWILRLARSSSNGEILVPEKCMHCRIDNVTMQNVSSSSRRCMKCHNYKSHPNSSVTENVKQWRSLSLSFLQTSSQIFSQGFPIKSLVACRSVCKTFFDISTSNPYFNSLHSSKTALNLIIQLGSVYNPSRFVHLVDSELDTAFVFGEKAILKLMFQIPNYPGRYFERYRVHSVEENSFVLVNSSDGLLYFAERYVCERSFVCNPITNEYVTLPEFDKERDRRQLTIGLWFGFSLGENRYKVLRIFSTLTGRPWENGFKQEFFAQVHVVGSSLWRDIKDQPPSEYLTWDTCFTLLNGTVYWLCRYPELSKFIIFFDFQQENLGKFRCLLNLRPAGK